MPNADRRTLLKMSIAGNGALIAAPCLAAPSDCATAAGFEHLIVRHRKIQVDGLDIFYREAGRPDAPVVLLGKSLGEEPRSAARLAR